MTFNPGTKLGAYRKYVRRPYHARCVHLMLILLILIGTLLGQEKRVGRIAFFGQEGLDVEGIRNALPFHEGETLSITAFQRDEWKQNVQQAVRQVIGDDPTDVARVCCNEAGDLLIYIGLPGKSSHPVRYDAAPRGNRRLPSGVVALNKEINDAGMKAVLEGRAGEDRSKGYALANDLPFRNKQLELREYALKNEREIFNVLQSSSDKVHRAIAANALGYARQTDKQVAGLVKAAFDADDEVRNNAVRALGVLLSAKPELGRRIPAQRFIDLLSSPVWSDRNKASSVLVSLTTTRDPKLLGLLRSQALMPLVEMARWPIGHAYPFSIILGRIAGIEESRLNDLAGTGQVGAIVSAIH